MNEFDACQTVLDTLSNFQWNFQFAMSELPETITDLTARVAWRWRVQFALAALVVGVAVAAFWFLLLNLTRMATGFVPPSSFCWAFATTVVAGSAVWGYSHKPSVLMSAQLIDRRFNLKGRTAASVQFARQKPLSSMHQLQIADAARRVEGLEARDVVALALPERASTAAVVVCLSFATILLPTRTPGELPKAPPSADVEDAVNALTDQLEQLSEIARASGMDDVEDLIVELKRDLRELEESDPDVRQAFQTVSQMQQKLRATAAAMNTSTVDQQLEDVSEALSVANDFKAAADALESDDLESAANALEAINSPQLTKREIDPTTEKLRDAAKAAQERDLSEIAETLEELADGVEKNDAAEMEKQSQKLADEVRAQDTRRKVSQMLTRKADAFGQSKRMIRARGNRSGNGGASGRGLNLEKGKTSREATGSSQKAGAKSAGNIDGEKTRLDGQRQMARLKGQLTDSGASEKTTEDGGESDDSATRSAREVYSEYQRMSDAVLDEEQIPLGRRETIRRYFELIRPKGHSSTVDQK